MAGKKQATAKSNKKTNNRASSSRASAAKTNKQQSLADLEASRRKRVIAIICFCAFAVFMGAVVLIDAGGVWGSLRNFFFGVFGVAAFIAPFFILIVSIVCALGKNTKGFKRAVIFGVILYTLTIAFVHIVQTDAALSYGEKIAAAYNTFKSYTGARGVHYGTGVFGALFGGVALAVTGGNKVAAGFINVFLICVLSVAYLAVFKGVSLSGVLSHFKRSDEEEIYEVNEEAGKSKKTEEKPEKAPMKAEEHTRKRLKKGDAEEFAFDVPLSEKESHPDMGLDNIFKNDASIFGEAATSVTMKAAPPKKHAVTEEPVNIDLLDSFEDSPVKNAPPLEELFGVKSKTRADERLEMLIDEPETQKENFEEKLTEQKLTSSEVDLAKAEIESEIAENALPEKQYELPPLDCLCEPKEGGSTDNEKELRERAEKIVSTLQSFGVGTHIVDICRSPSVTRFELQPDPGVKISRITALSDDIAMNLAASGVRIEAPIPNKNAVGIEVPNSEKTTVTLREIIDTPLFKNSKSKLNVALGRNIQGEPTCCDIAKMPHLLVAGTTGSGKSVCLNSMIVSILYNATPDEVKLVMIDPKKVEFTVYRSIPHLLVPVVSDPRKAAGALSWAVAEMDKRYQTFAENGVRNLQGYNAFAVAEGLPKMPQIVIIIDELADLMMAASNEVEDLICRLAQKARAAGMHLIVATQRPSVDVITGLIKANIPSRIAFAVKSQVDSRTIIDTQGAEKLLGYGDMLFCPVGLSKPLRVQGAYLSDEEIERVVDFVKTQGEVSYDESVIKEIEEKAAKEDSKKKGASVSAEVGTEDGDEMVPKAIEVVVEAGAASTTLLQRKLKLGYARAARVMDELEEKGVIGPYEGAKPRKVLITRDQWYEMQALSGASVKPVEKPQPSFFDEPQRDDVAGEEHNYFGGTVNDSFGDEEEEL